MASLIHNLLRTLLLIPVVMVPWLLSYMAPEPSEPAEPAPPPPPIVSTSPPELQDTLSNAFEKDCCNFAALFEDADWQDKETRRSFVNEVLLREKRFFATPNVSYDADTGMTYDGHALDPSSGDLLRGPYPAGPRVWSAASKESLHLAILVLSLEPALAFPDDLNVTIYTPQDALNILELKVTSMESFDTQFPGFGGFLPWFCSRGAKVYQVVRDGTMKTERFCRDLGDAPGLPAPTSDWMDRVPALDNGQLAWSTYAVVRVLENLGKGGDQSIVKLAGRWNKRLQRMRQTAVHLFYDGKGSGQVRAVTKIHNTSRDILEPSNAAKDTEEAYILDDPYEGELMVLFMDLLAEWKGYANEGATEKTSVWQHKQHKVMAVNYTAKDSKITVQKGHWFSSHEQWKLLVLPYMDLPLPRRIFMNCERARVHHSAINGVPGLYASATPPDGVRCEPHGYCSATGIQSIAHQPVSFTESISPYAAFPVILASRSHGLAWYNKMLALPQMQTQYGSVESAHVAGTSIASILTWDAKVTTILAILGGIGGQLRQYLDQDGLLARFNQTVVDMYMAEFETKLLHGEDVPFQMPPARPLATGEFPTCKCIDKGSIKVMKDTPIQI